MALDTLQWPTPDDYSTAMGNLGQLAIPNWLKAGIVEENVFGNVRRYSGAGLYTSTYKVKLEPSPESPSGFWMARCFCTTDRGSPPKDIYKRYPNISIFCNAYLSNTRANSALLHVRYVEQALRVIYIDENTNQSTGEEVVPIVLMPFVDNAEPLGTYIAMHYQERERMEELCRAWLTMLKELYMANVAHGDLDLTNVLVQEKANRLHLKLIDYDNMWIPILKDFPQTELGHDGFQHPTLLANKSRPYDGTMDRFAALSIYISIRALSLYKELYMECKADDTHHLLFSKEDYLKEIAFATSPYLRGNPADMGTIAKLKSKNNPYLSPYLIDLCYALYNGCMPNYNVFDVPPDLGAYGMPEPLRQTMAEHDTTPAASPVQPVQPPQSSQMDNVPSIPFTAVPTDPIPSAPLPPTDPVVFRRQRPKRSSAVPVIIVAVIVIIIIAIAIAIYLYVQAHSRPTSLNGEWLLLVMTVQRWQSVLPVFAGGGAI